MLYSQNLEIDFLLLLKSDKKSMSKFSFSVKKSLILINQPFQGYMYDKNFLSSEIQLSIIKLPLFVLLIKKVSFTSLFGIRNTKNRVKFFSFLLLGPLLDTLLHFQLRLNKVELLRVERGDSKKKANMKAAYMSLSEIESNFGFALLFNALTFVSVFDHSNVSKVVLLVIKFILCLSNNKQTPI